MLACIQFFNFGETYPLGGGLTVGPSVIRFARRLSPLPNADVGGAPHMPGIPIGIPIGWPILHKTYSSIQSGGPDGAEEGGEGAACLLFASLMLYVVSPKWWCS